MIPPHERRILEAHVKGISLSQLTLDERPLNEYEEQELKNLIKLRMRGLPLQYLTGSQDFYGREFYVNTAVLVPRPETEGLVELALKNLPSPSEDGQTLSVLEFGAGSGCISLTLAMERSDPRILSTECSEDAMTVCRENARRLRVTNADFLQVSEEAALWQYQDLPLVDMLISNPPYLLPSEEIASDVRDHEPPEALYAPDGDPLHFYKFLASLAEKLLKPQGFGVFEIAEQRGRETAEVFEAAGYVVQTFQDLAGRDRYLLARKQSAVSNG